MQPLLASIVARASAPWERAAFTGFVPRPDQDAAIDRRIKQWVDDVAAGDPGVLADVLHLRGQDNEGLRRSLADADVRAGGELPEWAAVLARLLDEMAEFEATGWRPDLPLLRDGVPLAFTALLPLVYSGAKFLDHAVSARPVEVDDYARVQILRTLEGRLLSVTMHVMDEEVRTAAAVARMLGDRGDGAAPDSSAAGWLDRLDRYPVLGRLVAVSYRNWCQLVEELLARLAEDLPLITQALFDGRRPGALVRFSGDAGDLHEQGRAVALLEFDGGQRLVYKPKDLRIADRFQALVDACNRQGLHPRLPVRKVIARDAYTWEEFVPDAPGRSESELEQFYARLGMFARLLQLLGGRDFWFDNVIASGANPALIDLETAIQQRPRTPPSRLSPAEAAAYEWLEESAVSIGLVAHCTPIAEGIAAEDIGAMTPPRIFTTPFRFEYSDDVGRVLQPELSGDGFVQWTKTDYAPTLDGSPVSAADYFESFADGYAAMHQHLAKHRKELAEPDGPLAALGTVPVRHIVRDTWSCMKIINASLRSPLLVDGWRREWFLEGLFRQAAADGTTDPMLLTCIQSEIDAFRDLDIPLFQTLPAQSAVRLRDGRALAGFFPGNAMDRVWSRLRDIDDVDVDEQIELLRSNLSTGAHPARLFDPPAVAADARAVGTDWLDLAVELGDLILTWSFSGGEGELAWLGLTFHPAHGLRALEVLRPDILTGTCGLAILFADLHRATGYARFAQAATGALGSTRRMISDSPRLFAQLRRDPSRSGTVACGRWYGIGSQIEALRRVGKTLGDPRVSDLAADYVAALDFDGLVGRAPVDLVGGVAGLLIALLTSNAATGQRQCDDAIMMTNAVLDQLDAAGVHAVWPYPGVPGPPNALPDGAGGVLLALDRARPFADGHGRRRIDAWSAKLDRHRRQAASPYQQLLVGLPREPEGAAGPLTAEAVGFLGHELHRKSSTELLDVIEVALAVTSPDVAEQAKWHAQAAATVLVNRHQATGHWFPDEHAADRHNLSLLTGLAAVAHAFLRCADPATIASVRALE